MTASRSLKAASDLSSIVVKIKKSFFLPEAENVVRKVNRLLIERNKTLKDPNLEESKKV